MCLVQRFFVCHTYFRFLIGLISAITLPGMLGLIGLFLQGSDVGERRERRRGCTC